MEGNGLYVNLAVATIRMNATILIRTSSILKLDRIPLRFLSVPLKDDEDILQCLICLLVCLMEQVVPEELDEERWGPLWSLINEKKASLSRTLQKVEELLGRPVWPEISFFWKLMWAVSPAEQGQLLLIYVEKLICYSLQWLLHVQNWCILMTCFSS